MNQLLFSKNFRRNLYLILATIVLTIFTIESISFVIIKIKSKITKPIAAENLYETDRNTELGYTLKKNNIHTGTKFFPDGKIIYSAKYTTDQYRRRNVGQEYLKNKKHLILFGCSEMYGEGLNDNETLQYMLHKRLPQYNIYNYAVFGYGPHHMLALLQNNNLTDEVHSKEGIAIYGFIYDHIYRSIPNSSNISLMNSPYYYLDKNSSLKRNGSLLTGRPKTTSFYKAISKSSFMQLSNLKLPFISEKHIQLTYKIISESKRQYEKQFKGKFYVLLLFSHPRRRDEKLINLLIKNNISVITPNFDTNKPLYEIKGDGHYNAKFNKLLSKQLEELFSNPNQQ